MREQGFKDGRAKAAGALDDLPRFLKRFSLSHIAQQFQKGAFRNRDKDGGMTCGQRLQPEIRGEIP